MTTREIFDDVWKNGDYRRGSTAQRLVPLLAQYIPAGATVNDYGSGTGRAEPDLLARGCRVNMVDISDEALEPGTRALVDGERLTYTVADLAALPEGFPVADWGICINVLMTVDPAGLDAILAGIRRTCRNLIIEAYDMAYRRRGRDMTTVKLDAAGWASALARHWPHVESVPSPEHKRRFITICRS